MGSGELLLILIVAIIVFGPDKLSLLARTLGRILARGKQFLATIQEQIDNELKQQKLENNLDRAKQADKQYKR